jgi:hypothetical protein
VSRPKLEVADIFRDHGAAWRSANAGHVSLDQLKVMSAIERCRTAALGGHVERCENCSHRTLRAAFCSLAASRRRAAADRPGDQELREALQRTYAATPDPKWVVAVGDCAVDGGLFLGSYAVVGAVEKVIPIDLHIRGCPPRPIELLTGLLALLEAA